MNETSYPKLSIEEFGARLIESQDLDPVYTVVHHAKLDPDHLRRWELAYWMSYNAGVVSYISERQDGDFWDAMKTFATNTVPAPTGGRWPRGRERRHYRGVAGEKSVAWLAEKYPHPEDAVKWLEVPPIDSQGYPYRLLASKVQEWPLFGPWIAFKVGDMLERLNGIQLDFSGSDIAFFSSPQKAAKQWVEQDSRYTGVKFDRVGTYVMEACVHIEKALGDRLAPPRFERKINLQEIETVLCKWGSHMNWHYPIGIDTVELKEALEPWVPFSSTAERLLEGLPPQPANG
jgi:hypothetical protein